MPLDRPTGLVVEDNTLIAMDVASCLEDCGCVAIGPVGTVPEALDAVRTTSLSAAILDINLGNERVWPVAELLEDRNVPFVLATGYSTAEIPERFRDRPLLSKPLTTNDIGKCLRAMRLAPV